MHLFRRFSRRIRRRGRQPRGRKAKRPDLQWTWQQAQAFYQTPEWKRKRWEIIQKHGRRCFNCGARPEPGNNIVIQVDHKIPLRMRPDLALDDDNLRPYCSDCNEGKGNKLDKDL